MAADNARYFRASIPGTNGRKAGYIVIDREVALQMWRRYHAMQWGGSFYATEGAPTIDDSRQYLPEAAARIAEQVSLDLPISLNLAKTPPAVIEEPSATADDNLQRVDQHVRTRDHIASNLSSLRFLADLGRPVDKVLGPSRERLPLGESPHLTVAEYLGMAVELGNRRAVQRVCRWLLRHAKKAPKTQDWVTILRTYAHTYRAVQDLLPKIKGREAWALHAKETISQRVEAAGVKREMLFNHRARRAPAKIAALVVAHECRKNGMRVQATTISRMWKQRRRLLPSGDFLLSQ